MIGKIPRMYGRSWRYIAAMAMLGLCAPWAVSAGYPERPITLVVPWSAGGPADTVARIFAKDLASEVGQSVIVENKAGAGGNIGTAAVARTAPDGHTFLLATSSTNAISPWLIKEEPFRPVVDFTPISLLSSNSNVLVVRSDSRYQSLEDVVQDARKRPNVLNYASGGVGSSQHVAGSMFTRQLGLDIVHVPYNGGGPAAKALLAGEVSIVLDTGSLAAINAGSLRALAVASKDRLPMLPEVPTFAELGYPDMVTGAWYAIVGPAGLPASITDYLNSKINEIVRCPQFVEKLAAIGAVAAKPMSPRQVGEYMRTELKRYEVIVSQLDPDKP